MKRVLKLDKIQARRVQGPRFEKRYVLLFLIIASFVFFLLRLPSLFEPHWYGDEGIYQVIGEIVNKGGLLYRDVWDNKPPLLYLLYALFNSDQFTIRLASLVIGVFSVVMFFFLSKRLFPHFILASSVFALLLGLPIIEGNIANAENFMMPFILISALFVFKSKQSFTNTAALKSRLKFSIFNFLSARQAGQFSIFIAGFLLGIAFLFKVVAIFDFLAFISFLIIINLPSKLKLSILKEYLLSSTQKILPFIVGFFIPIVVAVFYFWAQGAFIDLLRATFSSNISYVAWQNKLAFFPQDLLLLKTALLIIVVFLIVRKHKELGTSATFILFWFVFSLYNAFFTQRPYTHYLLTLLPSFSLLFGLILSEGKYRKAMILFFISAFVLILTNFNLYDKTTAYYQNFISFITESKSVSSYRAFFDKRTPIDYEIAIYLKSKIRGNESIFIWGDNAQVYKMVGVTPPGKYIVSYHIIGNKDGIDNTRDVIEKKKPRFIIIMPSLEFPPFQLVRYHERIRIDKVSIYERFF